MLLYFRASGHDNYAKEAIKLLTLVNATGTPRLAAQVTWSRIVNTKGKSGYNIPVDLYNEHLNRTLKDAVSGLGPNITKNSIIQCGKSLNGLIGVVNCFDKEHGIHDESTRHNKACLSKDEKLILEELTKTSKVFDYVPGRQHRSFLSIKPNVAQSLDITKTVGWIKGHLSSIQASVNVAKLYGHNI